jgi:hypothetical protein
MAVVADGNVCGGQAEIRLLMVFESDIATFTDSLASHSSRYSLAKEDGTVGLE